MKKWKVTVVVTLTHEGFCEANSEEEAIEKAKDAFNDYDKECRFFSVNCDDDIFAEEL